MTIRAVYRNAHGQALHAIPFGDGRYTIVDRKEADLTISFEVKGNTVRFAKSPSEVRNSTPFTGVLHEPPDEGVIFEGSDDLPSEGKVTLQIERQDRSLDVGSQFGVPDKHRINIRKER